MEIEELRKTINEADRQLKSCDDAFQGTLNTIYLHTWPHIFHETTGPYTSHAATVSYCRSITNQNTATIFMNNLGLGLHNRLSENGR